MMTDPERRLESATAVLERALADAEGRRRAELGLSQTALARRLGVSQPTVARWESGEHVPEITTLVRLAETLGLHVALEIVPAHPGEGTAVVEEDAETPQGVRLHALLAVR
jgi:transcriptional regulator with XRE-family HTH domain